MYHIFQAPYLLQHNNKNFNPISNQQQQLFYNPETTNVLILFHYCRFHWNIKMPFQLLLALALTIVASNVTGK